MNPELKTLWLEALRSGKYEQGQQFLNRNDKLCCLGVLCEVMVELDPTIHAITVKDSEVGGHGVSRSFTVKKYGGGSRMIPHTLLSRAKITTMEAKRLAVLNDEHGLSFEEIAKQIEENM